MKCAFTLIELLVVVSIIVVLMSILLPTMEEAVYQSRLTRCAAQLRGVGVGVLGYASDHANWYPYNPAHEYPGRNWLSTHLSLNSPQDPVQGYPEFRWDMRAALRGYLPINKTMIDPLMTHPIELEATSADTVAGSYSLRFGWKWRLDHDGRRGVEEGALKVGQKFSWSFDWEDQDAASYRFSVLASDYDLVSPFARSSHPDRRGVMTIWPRQDAPDGNGGTVTRALWIGDDREPRGTVDTNYAYQDGAVHRFSHVTLSDDRMVRVPIYNRGNHPNDLSLVEAHVEQIPRE